MAFPRDDYRSLSTYDPGRSPVALDLSDNTNLWGPHPAALERIRSAGPDDVRGYPEPYADRLRVAVGRRLGVMQSAVTTGAGSDDLLDSAFRAAGGAGEAVAFPEPTFSMIADLARANGMTPRPLPWEEALADPGALLADAPAVVYVCRPNNPTGALAPAEWVERLVELAGADGPLIVVDEAYADFAGTTLAPLAVRSPRLLVVRTCSKAYGLAGVRVGFGVARPDVALEIEKSRGPYKVSRLAAEAAITALDDADGWVARTAAECVANRERLRGELAARGLAPLESHANFLLFRAPSGSAAADAVALRGAGIGVRPFPRLPATGDALRVTVGPWPFMERFLEALDAVSRARMEEPA